MAGTATMERRATAAQLRTAETMISGVQAYPESWAARLASPEAYLEAEGSLRTRSTVRAAEACIAALRSGDAQALVQAQQQLTEAQARAVAVKAERERLATLPARWEAAMKAAAEMQAAERAQQAAQPTRLALAPSYEHGPWERRAPCGYPGCRGKGDPLCDDCSA